MISKIRSFQDSWLVKGILILTALSFMSLFGISGYIGRSGANRPIVRVDDIGITHDEINYQLNEQVQNTKNMFGDNVEINDAMRNAMLLDIVQKNLINAILQKTAENNRVVISDELIRKIIYSQPEFMDASGQFDINKMRRMLSLTGWSEKKYIDTLRRDIIKQHLVHTPVMDITMPKFMDMYWAEIDGQRKTFEFTVIDPTKLKIDRKISEDEVEQYYQDFAPQFTEPESRDVSFIELSVDELAQTINPTEEEIKTYYNDNISQYVIPEKRHVLQMVFDDQTTADKAEAALNAGGDFFKVAKDIAKQDKAITDLGEVAKDML
ncbi:MAG: peptidylprolyl isomerase, partial [Alphaproteobacteria bacterium]|nr:peptidylprolyl isomerase [Alphaproteobacteria bacterium]